MRSVPAVLCGLALVACSSGPPPRAPQAKRAEVQVVQGRHTPANAFLIHDGVGAVVVDCLGSTTDGQRVVDQLHALQLEPSHVLLTHPHADRLAGLPVLHRAFPEARVVVHHDAIKAALLEDVRLSGIDLDELVTVLRAPSLRLPGGDELVLRTAWAPASCTFSTLVEIPTTQDALLGALLYNRVHPRCGELDRDQLDRWRVTLRGLEARYLHWTLHPGYGSDPADVGTFIDLRRYLKSFVEVVQTAAYRDEAQAEITRLYPDWAAEHRLLPGSIAGHLAE